MKKFQINNKSKDVHIVVGKSFVRVVKNHKFYDIFKKSFDKMMKMPKSDRNPFGKFDSFDTLMNAIKDFTVSQHRVFRDDYEFITMMINHMLHFFLENGGVDPRRLGMYGQEIFDIACYALYGDKYINDMDKMNHSAPKPKNDLEAYLVGEFMKLRNDGMDLSWEQFIQKFMPNVDIRQFNEANYKDNRSTICDEDFFGTFDDEDEDIFGDFDDEDGEF